ncbi:hypothetical protein L3X38_019385 [Prunus dulcis]|uniref:Uncharacterized protein n=1 Tax=Prunus dulcis TaxID=3755 RepID=A0AAD4WDE5_PRUDU|nr:hypothetical protein L3X38_019385 [Prunus dulcis]
MRISKVHRVNLLKDAIRLSRGPNSSLIREETDLGMKISKKDMLDFARAPKHTWRSGSSSPSFSSSFKMKMWLHMRIGLFPSLCTLGWS